MSDEPVKTPVPEPALSTQARPGRQTSEYWVTVAFAGVIVLAAVVGFALGKIDWSRAGELLTLGLGILGLGYSASRGLSKQGPLKVLLPLALVWLVTGCGQPTLRQALDGAHQGIKAVSSIYEPALQAQCLERARACKGKVIKVEECTPYVTCRDVQRQLSTAVALIQTQLGAAERARALAEAAGLKVTP
jgi:hypothetical protein